MPKKTQAKVSNVRLRRSKTPKPPKPELESDEEVIEINDQEPEIESEPEELPIVEKPKPKPKRKPRPSRAKPPNTIGSVPNLHIDFKAEREAFNNYINEQRELLAKERAQHLESLKAEAKIERQSLTNTRDARLRLMSSLQL
jgi:hypothetical protein